MPHRRMNPSRRPRSRSFSKRGRRRSPATPRARVGAGRSTSIAMGAPAPKRSKERPIPAASGRGWDIYGNIALELVHDDAERRLLERPLAELDTRPGPLRTEAGRTRAG